MPPSVTYMNQSAPFWDFVASLEQQQDRNGGDNDNNERHGPPGPPPFGPWGWAHGFGGRGFPSRGPPPPGHHHAPGPPPPAGHEHASNEKDDDIKEKDKEMTEDNGEGPSHTSGSDTESNRRPYGRGRCGGRKGRHAWGHGGPHAWGGPHGHHNRGGHHGGGRGGWGGWGSRGGFDPLSLAANFFNPENFGADARNMASDDYAPDADIFDTPTAYMVHISLAGAKKEDVGVNWDEAKSELSVAGVIYRPGDEEFLKTLAMDERKVGAFERKIRLGTRVNPAAIDAEGISAKLEDGVLRVDVPKRLEEGFVDVRKVDVE
ncbi:HSP20-like chaperone [Polyplosphaeria fusca]|uniref:HSP20-like chaperone n=1 Tax=Polyplosphaeria fusca TaxID=682080 RepID=A0A9P4R238_9PLEO|nr:HSP20-like chaperone [Polyplosphaeria fusca]